MGGSLGTLYLLNALASAAGALIFSFGLTPAIGVAKSYQAVVILHVTVAAVFGYYVSRRAAWLVSPIVLILAAVFTLRAIDRRDLFGDAIFQTPEYGMELLDHRETADASFSVYEQTSSGVRQLYINGFMAADASYLANYMPMMAHLPLLLHEEPRRVLVIAFGTGSTAGAASLHPIDQLHVVDISGEVYDLAPYFSATNHDVLSDPRTKALVEDGRNYVQSTEETYDVITSEPMPPKFAGMVNFYTREYYQAAHSRLTANGIICQWLPFHLMSFEDARMVSQTFLDVFPNASLWVVRSTPLLIGSKAPNPLSADTLARGFENPTTKESLERLGFRSPRHILATLKLDSEGLRIFAGNAPVLTDDQPFMEFSGDYYMYRSEAGLTHGAIKRAQRQLRSP
jgi:spermidine synthase